MSSPSPIRLRTSLGMVLTAAPHPSWGTNAFVLVDSFYARPTILTGLAGALADI